jgi:thiamine-monophosphate kinase
VIDFFGTYLVITTDFLNDRPIAVQMGLADYAVLGRLLVASNLADLVSTGAQPEGLLVGAMLPRGSQRQSFEQFIEGVDGAARRYGVRIVGGDTKLGERRCLYGVAFGSVARRANLMLKNGGCSGDALFVSGDLGSCNAAVLGLGLGLDDEALLAWFKQAITDPQLPINNALTLSSKGIAHAGADISDGLGADIEKLCRASTVGAVVDVQRIPIAPNAKRVAKALGVPPWALSFGGGGDYQLLVSGPRHLASAICNCGFVEIGYLTPALDLLIEVGEGQVRPMPTAGHRDARGRDFHAEIETLVRRAAGDS